MCIRDRGTGLSCGTKVAVSQNSDITVTLCPRNDVQSMVKSIAVSYTHLDVYKRQLLCSIHFLSLLNSMFRKCFKYFYVINQNQVRHKKINI